MRFSFAAVVALITTASIAAFPVSQKTTIARSTSLSMSSADFSTSFKQGLKYVLVPQSANRVKLPYYDNIPESTVSENVLSTGKAAAQSVANIPAPEIVSDPFVGSINMEQNTILAASGEPFTPSTLYVDPIIPQTIDKIINAIKIPDEISKLDPEYRGLSTPVIKLMQKYLEEAQQIQQIPLKFFENLGFSLEDESYETIAYGFQVKTSIAQKWKELHFDIPVAPLDKLQGAYDALNFEELGAWYAGAIVGILLLIAWSNEAGNAVAYRGGASRPASSKMSDADKVRLENMVADLTKAVEALTQELQQLKEEKKQTDLVLGNVQTELQSMKLQLAASTNNENKLKSEVANLQQENAVLRSKLEKAQTEVIELIQENALLTEKVVDLGVSAKKEPQAPNSAPPEKLVKVMIDDTFFASVTEKNEIAKSQMNSSDNDNTLSVMTATAESGTKAVNDSAKVCSQAPATNKFINDGMDDLSGLTLSMLKRKTVTELTAYLERMGKSTIGPNGRPLKKQDLVEIVFNAA
jgi:hypothetical protein